MALEENGPRVAKEEVLRRRRKRPLRLAKEILLRAENKAAEVKGRDRMLKIVWLRTESNPLIVVTGECPGERLKGTQDKQRITKLRIAWEGGAQPEALPLPGEAALLHWR